MWDKLPEELRCAILEFCCCDQEAVMIKASDSDESVDKRSETSPSTNAIDDRRSDNGRQNSQATPLAYRIAYVPLPLGLVDRAWHHSWKGTNKRLAAFKLLDHHRYTFRTIRVPPAARHICYFKMHLKLFCAFCPDCATELHHEDYTAVGLQVVDPSFGTHLLTRE